MKIRLAWFGFYGTNLPKRGVSFVADKIETDLPRLSPLLGANAEHCDDADARRTVNAVLNFIFFYGCDWKLEDSKIDVGWKV